MDVDRRIPQRAFPARDCGRPLQSASETDARGAIDPPALPGFDPSFYRDNYKDLSGMNDDDAVRHYCHTGWLEGRNPNDWFDTCVYLALHDDVRHAGIDPFLHYLGWGRAEGRAIGAPAPVRDINRHLFGDPDLDWRTLVAPVFDETFYAAQFDEPIPPGLDLLAHYLFRGWREGRLPYVGYRITPHHTDIGELARCIAPIVVEMALASRGPVLVRKVRSRMATPDGTIQAEARRPGRPGSSRRKILEMLKSPEQRAGNASPEHTRLAPADLARLILDAVAGHAGLVWSSSHDCYPDIVGGTQIFIADEQRLFASLGIAYLHASPLRASFLMNDHPPDETLTRLVINGSVVGVATDAEIADALGAMGRDLPRDRTYVVHSVLGHSLSGMMAIRDALQPTHAYFWLHDYAALCSGYNLLRNDVEYCHCPPPGAQACNICIYGQSRGQHTALVARLFAACDFTVAAPSGVALSIWRSHARMPHANAVMIEHCTIEDPATHPDPRPVDTIGTQDNLVQIAFIGYPLPHKGWPTFSTIVETTGDRAGYRFFHFAGPGALTRSDAITSVAAEVTPGRRDAMTALLVEHAIDLVVMPAPWPETFSYALFEALAAGCDVVTLAHSGNIAAVVSGTGRGVVFDTEDDLVGFFRDHAAIAHVRARAIAGIRRGRLAHSGTTASIHIASGGSA